MWNRPRMFGPSTSSNGRSTDTPPRCTMAPQPSASRSMVTPSFRSALVKDAPEGMAWGNGATSVSWREKPSADSDRVSTRPRAPDAPVSSTLAGGSGLAAAVVMACWLLIRLWGAIMRTLEQTANALADGNTTSRVLVEECLARIADPAGEGARAFIKTDPDWARTLADA